MKVSQIAPVKKIHSRQAQKLYFPTKRSHFPTKRSQVRGKRCETATLKG